MSIADLRGITSRLQVSAGTLAVLGAAMDARVSGKPFDAAMQPRVDAILDALGAKALVSELSPPELSAALAEIRMTLNQGGKLLYPPARTRGWSHMDAEMLQAAGDTSAGFAMTCKQMVVPKLAGLAERLEAGGVFLDVGTGVGAFAMAMARNWPALRVVGVDPWAPSIAIGRENVKKAGLADRIELREQGGEAVPERNAFDLAWIPSLFIPESAIGGIVKATLGALKPGGWVLFATANPPADPVAAAYIELRTMIWGGAPFKPADVEPMLAAAGFVDVQTLPAPPGAPAAMVAARKGVPA